MCVREIPESPDVQNWKILELERRLETISSKPDVFPWKTEASLKEWLGGAVALESENPALEHRSPGF